MRFNIKNKKNVRYVVVTCIFEWSTDPILGYKDSPNWRLISGPSCRFE